MEPTYIALGAVADVTKLSGFELDTCTCRYCTRDTGTGITADTLFLQPRNKSTETLKQTGLFCFIASVN